VYDVQTIRVLMFTGDLVIREHVGQLLDKMDDLLMPRHVGHGKASSPHSMSLPGEREGQGGRKRRGWLIFGYIFIVTTISENSTNNKTCITGMYIWCYKLKFNREEEKH
jgi:hypothetical protein